MPDILMACGCRPHGTFQDKPCCAVHLCTEVAKKQPNLEGRKAKCYCGSIIDSSLSLAFFEYRGEGSNQAIDTCKHCRMYKCAHEYDASRLDARTVVEKGHCPGFESAGPAETDIYYCGCRGFD
jgi:hypothetical protein